jgi:hypothetical protein
MIRDPEQRMAVVGLTVICRGCLKIDLSTRICGAVHERCSRFELPRGRTLFEQGEGTVRSIVVATCAFALAGCATAYQPMGFSGGYSEVQLNADTYQILVAGNGYTSTDRAQKIALLRAADLTIAAGFKRFVVLSGNVSQQYAGNAPVVANAVGNTVIASGGEPINKPSGGMTFHFVSPTDPAFASAMDAELIAAQIRPQLVHQ